MLFVLNVEFGWRLVLEGSAEESGLADEVRNRLLGEIGMNLLGVLPTVFDFTIIVSRTIMR